MDEARDQALAERLEAVSDRVRSAAGGRDVRLVVVTKGFPLGVVRAAIAAGARELGENFADELVEKASALESDPELASTATPVWHFLGALQRNKVARLSPYVACYQSIDRLEEGTSVKKRSDASVLVEIDTTGAPGRAGVAPSAAPGLVEALVDAGVAVEGLMTVAPREEMEAARCFSTVRRLCDELGLFVCSMGMSGDFELALKEGSTMVRLGQAIFGPRPAKMPTATADLAQ